MVKDQTLATDSLTEKPRLVVFYSYGEDNYRIIFEWDVFRTQVFCKLRPFLTLMFGIILQKDSHSRSGVISRGYWDLELKL